LPNDQDERVAALQSVKLRRGQAAFRSELLVHFQRRCVFSDCSVEEILEAAHIHPYRGTKDHHVENGLLLRADLHTLFDLSLLAIDPQTHQLLLAPHVAQDPHYEALANKKIQFPKKQPPNRQALEARFKQFLANNPSLIR
jgi:predicted restriction endonuclease